MANPYQGEATLSINGKEYAMRLSLGALAELETKLSCASLVSFVEKFESGTFRTADMVLLLHAGLKCSGWHGDEQDLMKSCVDGGPLAAAKAAGNLLRVTFSFPA